ncbi:hypothetical protein U0070_026450, partial [Myodes glareolus]
MLLDAAREGRTVQVSALLSRPSPPNVNCSDQLGNTPLHCAAYRAHKQCALKLLRSGADPNLKNKNDQKPLDLAHGAEMKHILVGNKVSPTERCGDMKVLSGRSDAVRNTYRQGCKHLTQAVCTVKPTDSCLFSIRCFDDSVHGFRVPKNSLQQSRETWLEAIEEHSAYSTHYCSQDQVTDEEEEDAVSPMDLKEALERTQTCQQRLDKEIYNFLKMIKEYDVAK